MLSRRQVLQSAAGVCVVGTADSIEASQAGRRPKVAMLMTECRQRSHGHVILENFIERPLFRGEWLDPGCDIVAIWEDQHPEKDLAPGVARTYGIPTFNSIKEALCLGGNRLAVDAVLSIGEHGNYPVNSRGQREYPRKRFFDEIVAVFRESGRVVPVFNDKHLSYRWDWAREMYDTSRELGIPFMAGSSVPLAQRRPPIDIPAGARITEAVAVHGGPFESYDFHGFELLQSMVEGRAGGETGVEEMRHVSTPDALWKAAEAGEWSPDLAEAALKAEMGDQFPGLKEMVRREEQANTGRRRSGAWGTLIRYVDGTKGSVVRIGRSDMRWNFACRIAGRPDPVATSCYVGPWDNRCLFKALSHAIQAMFRTGKPSYPVERTLITTGMTDIMTASREAGDRPIGTPHLRIAYQPIDFSAFRENGKSWEVLPPTTPQPDGIHKPPIRLK